MISIHKIAAITVAMAAMCGAFAQSLLQQASAFITSPTVAMDMKLTSAQISKRDQLLADYQKKRTDISARFDAGKFGSTEAFQKELDRILLDVQVKLIAMLTPAQVTRLKQVAVQQVGVEALGDNDVATELGLTQAQRANILAIRDSVSKLELEYQEAMADALSKLPDPGNDPDAIKAYSDRQQAIVKALKPKERQYLAAKAKGQKDMVAVLTPAQQKKWTEMKGKPIKLG